MLIQLLEPNFNHHDERGSLTQLVREGYTQINVVASVAGAERGRHYHKKNAEAFFVIAGKFSLTVSKGDIKESYDFCAGDMFCVPPHVSHSFYFREYTLLVGMYSQGVENVDGTKDIHTDSPDFTQETEDI
ncbi:MAG: cupin domain-containing protein [Synergistaceae bacterium]|jgi:quercetin dioxygenase-like cupin family protein|nr:cupin domain-containing protein [Synergistaceae bacterium]